MGKKPVEEATMCSECEQLFDEKGVMRCRMFYGAMIKEPDEKHCKDSIR